jgi:hypothetical protein
MSAANENTLALMKSLGEQDFWGTLTVRFQHGQVVHISKEESIQPAPSTRSQYETNNQRSR